MKYSIIIFLFFLLSCKNDNRLTECCVGITGRCDGKDTCSVCTNCTKCAFCKSGGTCGVCQSKPKSKQSIYYSIPLKTKLLSPSDHIFVNVSKAYLRVGAGKEFDTIQSFKRNSILIYISSDGEWIKAKSLDSGLIGYIHFSMLRQ